MRARCAGPLIESLRLSVCTHSDPGGGQVAAGGPPGEAVLLFLHLFPDQRATPVPERRCPQPGVQATGHSRRVRPGDRTRGTIPHPFVAMRGRGHLGLAHFHALQEVIRCVHVSSSRWGGGHELRLLAEDEVAEMPETKHYFKPQGRYLACQPTAPFNYEDSVTVKIGPKVPPLRPSPSHFRRLTRHYSIHNRSHLLRVQCCRQTRGTITLSWSPSSRSLVLASSLSLSGERPRPYACIVQPTRFLPERGQPTRGAGQHLVQPSSGTRGRRRPEALGPCHLFLYLAIY